MDLDAYDYLEQEMGESESRKDSKDRRRSGSRQGRNEREDLVGGYGDGDERASKRSRAEERNGDGAYRDRRDRDRRGSSRDADKGRDRDRERHRSRERDHLKDKDSDKDKDRERDRERDMERDKKKDGERDRERDMERDRKKDGERDRDRDREKEREREMERERRSSSRSRRHDREVEMELERARSRERARERERELERDIRERESRRTKEKKESVEPEADLERDQRTVFAYQMPLKATDRDVYEFFSQAGKVRDVRLIMDRNSRRSKGVGYIEFYDVMAVPQAIAMSGQLFFGQPVMVKPSEAEKNLVQSSAAGGASGAAAERKLYVGNLHFSIKEENLREIFEPFGPVELVQLPLDQETGHCRGYGFVQFVQLEHAKAAQTLNGKLDIAGRIIKVSAVTDHVGMQDTGTNATDFDDDDGGGLSLNARSRALLMQKLDRTGTASSIAESLGVPILSGSAAMPAALPAQHAQSVDLIVQPSECLLLKNMFDPRTETEPDFDLEIKEDVQEECSKFGLVKHIYVDKMSEGCVYLQFDSAAAAANCQRSMHGRWFAGRSISVTFMRPQDYDTKFGRGA